MRQINERGRTLQPTTMKYVPLSAVTALLLALLAASHAADASKPVSKPNIVFLLADDLRPDCLGMLGHPIVKTPCLDKLLEHGFIFRNTYVLGSNIGAVCTPSRTMIQTGQSYLRANYTTPTLAQTIRAAGYASIRSGKFGNNPNDLDKDFDVHLDGGESAEGNANNIIAFIKEHAGKKPLFLYLRRTNRMTHNMQLASSTACMSPQTFPCRSISCRFITSTTAR